MWINQFHSILEMNFITMLNTGLNVCIVNLWYFHTCVSVGGSQAHPNSLKDLSVLRLLFTFRWISSCIVTPKKNSWKVWYAQCYRITWLTYSRKLWRASILTLWNRKYTPTYQLCKCKTYSGYSNSMHVSFNRPVSTVLVHTSCNCRLLKCELIYWLDSAMSDYLLSL